jgi:signal transduction histidine kinase
MIKKTDKLLYSSILRYMIAVIIIWTTTLVGSLVWNINNEKKQRYEMALHTARANFNKDQAYRFWATKHGGVYVQPTEKTPPNPYLAHLPHRDVVTTKGTKLTLMNPAYMLREMMEDYAQLYGITGRIVGLVALNPKNIADDWESKAIRLFQTNTVDEVIELADLNDIPHLRLIRPMRMKSGCMLCHQHLGFKVGDVRGAVGVSIPMTTYSKLGNIIIQDLIITHLIIYLLGLMMIIYIAYRVYLNIQERNQANNKLHGLNLELKSNVNILKQRETTINSMNEQLEQQVENRTQELKQSIEDLQKTQKQMVESEKMASLGSLVAGIAHEINTPIGISITATTLIQSETKEIINNLQSDNLGKNALGEYLQVVDKMSKSMFLSLNNAANLIRSFKQVATDQHIEEKRQFNLSNYVNDVLLSLNNKLKHTQIKVINDIDPTLEISSYAGIFSQIITNFVLNSIHHAFDDFSPLKPSQDKDSQHKTLQQQLDKLISITAFIESDSFNLIYKDNGKGIDEQIINKIFEPFFTTKFGQGGSGLGLNIIYNLVNHKLKGNIYCNSQLGKGMEMIVKIPVIELGLEKTE